jgi:large subunit ribosomal protein L22
MANATHNEARAEARYVRVSPQKVRLVIDSIRGQQAGSAIDILKSTNKRIAPTIEKVLRSAIANAENRYEDVDIDKLFVTEAYVNEGPRQKRIRPAPQGRAFRYQRRMAHIVVTVGEVAAKEQGEE